MKLIWGHQSWTLLTSNVRDMDGGVKDTATSHTWSMWDNTSKDILGIQQEAGFRVRETFELNQLKSAPSQRLVVFPGFDRLQTCCHWFGPANILCFFQVPAKFFFIVMTTKPRTWASISKLVFQCSKIMKCNNEAKALHVRHSPNYFKPITD